MGASIHNGNDWNGIKYTANHVHVKQGNRITINTLLPFGLRGGGARDGRVKGHAVRAMA